MRGTKKTATPIKDHELCEPLANYCKTLWGNVEAKPGKAIRVMELFAGVGGFRIGLERVSNRFKTVWSSQWEPSTRKQDASELYVKNFGPKGHSNEDIGTVAIKDMEPADVLVGGFPCQDYSVASTLKNAGGIEGKKGVLWWQIHRILRDSPKPPKYLILENVDRLLKSPVKQRGRDFAIILASLADLGYSAEWRVINAADYGMPQRRRRTYIVAYKNTTKLYKEYLLTEATKSITSTGVFAQVFGCKISDKKTAINDFELPRNNLIEVSENFNKGAIDSPFGNAGILCNHHVITMNVDPVYNGPRLTLGELLVPEKDVPKEFYISDDELKKWEYLKGSKSEKRVTKDGFEYQYSEGGMAFPDALDKPSRTIITGEGGKGASRFKHVIKTPSGKLRRLTPIELERLNMFPDNHTQGASDIRRAFLMGNALVTGIVEGIGSILIQKIG